LGDVALAATPWSGSETVTGWKPSAQAQQSSDTPGRAAEAPGSGPASFDQPIVAVGVSRQSASAPRARRLQPALLALVGAAALAGLITVVVIASTGSKGRTTTTTGTVPTSASRVASPSPSPAQSVDAAPANVTAQSVGNSVTLTWTLPPDDDHPLVLVQSPAATPVPTYLDMGTTHYSVGGLDPARTYCFKVGAVTAVGAGVSFQWAEPVCAKG
jgi:hypothetical protein